MLLQKKKTKQQQQQLYTKGANYWKIHQPTCIHLDKKIKQTNKTQLQKRIIIYNNKQQINNQRNNKNSNKA